MTRFTFAKLAKLGEHDEKYGTTYWGETNEQLEPVKFNSSNENITADDTIECEEQAEKKSAKGTVYLQLKKVRVVGSQGRGETSPPATNEAKPQPADQTPVLQSQLDRIEAKLDKLLGVQQEVEQDVPDFLRVEDEDGTS